MNMQVFVLAGGLGTRLRALSGERPKALMPIGGQPFLRRLLERLAAQRIREVVLCLGYGADTVQTYFADEPIERVRLHYSVEQEPRGTAGALRVAEQFWASDNLILNGDTEVAFDAPALFDFHRAQEAAVTIGLVQVSNAASFGRVQVDAQGQVRAFLEKDGRAAPGLVNAGVYLARRAALAQIAPTGAVSIERDWLPALLQHDSKLCGLVVADDFTDIGTPEGYWRLADRA